MLFQLRSIALIALALAACSPKYYGTLRTERPAIERSAFDELSRVTKLGLAPLSFAEVRFLSRDGELTEAQAFDGKREEKKASWDADKAAMQQIFAEALQTGAGPIEIVAVPSADSARGTAQYVVVADVLQIDPGFFVSSLISHEAVMNVRVKLVRVSDKAVVHQWTEKDTSAAGLSSGERVRSLAALSGSGAFRTLRALVKPVYAAAAKD